MKTLCIILIVTALLSLIIMLISDNEKLCNFSYEIHKISSAAFCTYCIICFINCNTPTAMDVYKGRTTLEITYRNDIPIDSVVVFKNKEEQQ